MTAFMEQAADAAGWPGDPHCAGAQHEAVYDRRMEKPVPADPPALASVPRHKRAAMVTRLVEAEILPRLAGTKRAGKAAAGGSETGSNLTTEADTAELVRRLMKQDAADSIAFLEVLQLRGASPASLYLGIITDAARCLGAMWDEDRCDFATVTISMGRLQQVVRALSPTFQTAALSRAHADSILLLPAPGEQHFFGLVILSEFFLREGWHVVGGPASRGNGPADTVRTTWVDVAGFSIASTVRIEALAQCIRDVRKASVNTDIKVMIGGPLLLTRPNLVMELGADASASDAPGAVREARGLLSMRTAAD
nr:cobalamin-dependent protein [uncultured Rhodopila sp.]